MRSMTGFGRGVAERGDLRATVDIRSVNHRFFDLKIRGPASAAAEDAIARVVRAAGIDRGALAVSVHLARPAAAVHLDRQAARATHAMLAALAAELGTAPPDLALVLAQPGVVRAERTDSGDDTEAAVEAIVAAATAAAARLVTMRATEGAALSADLTALLGALGAARGRIAEHASALPAQLQRRLAERVARLLADSAAGVDPDRLAHEVAVLADRADVSEELVRLASHLDQAAALVTEPTAPVGRRLDFLVQEIGRELNTIGSKSAAAEITALVVDAKATLEKVREQVQNVE
jgi:uncharacterized protein (TIGR00255 family)